MNHIPPLDNSYELPQKLRRVNYGKHAPGEDEIVNCATNRMHEELDAKLRKVAGKRKPSNPRNSNLTAFERDGLSWLERKVKAGEIAVVEADKGGAIIITTPGLLKKKTLEKLENPDLYEIIPDDPTKELHKELVELWIAGKTNGLVSATTANNVMGISNNDNKAGTGPTNRLSTLPHYRPGTSYFYPTLKIHKVPVEQLVPGVEPPCRLITALQDGVSKRSDVYLADRYLRLLERDFCQDLLIDSNDALWWLEVVNNTLDHNQKRGLRPFTFDYKALYDSLTPDLVCEALEIAMDELRDDWSEEKKQWILDLVKLSLKSAVGRYGNVFYRQKRGVPTGGSLCVQLANIAVYYIMRKFVYSDEALMSKMPCLKRYIDDGAGFYNGTKRQFGEFINTVNQRIGTVGLNIDEHNIVDPSNYVAFLDIQFTFDQEGSLQTDLYVKPTDSRSYLQYGSTHPNHVFSAIVYSQSLRLRRIINNDTRLRGRLEELKEAFLNSNYPANMVNNIIAKVASLSRVLKDRNNRSNAATISPTPVINRTARIITTYGSDADLVKVVETFEPSLVSSPSLSLLATDPENRTQQHKILSFVKRTGSSIRNKLVKSKQLALDTGVKGTQPCNRKNCKTCDSVSLLPVHKINDRRVEPKSGTCTTYNVIYALHCTACDKYYIGRTVRKLGDRFGEHRRKFYQLLKNPDFSNDHDDDEFSPGLHLTECHSATTEESFNEIYRVFIVDVCSPQTLDVREHKYIHELNTIKPFGINSVSPFGLPVLRFY